MVISKHGIELIKKHEGWRNNPYLCPAKIPTVGYGFTYYKDGTRVSLGDGPMTLREGEELLKHILNEFEGYVNSYVKVDLTHNQFDALVSFCYNLGPDNFSDSTLLKKINNNPSDPSIEDEFGKWIYAGGTKVKGLVKRRAYEWSLYNS